MIAVGAIRRRSIDGGGRRRARRAAPLAVGVVAVVVVALVFPTGIHGILGAPDARRDTTGQAGLYPLSLGSAGAGHAATGLRSGDGQAGGGSSGPGAGSGAGGAGGTGAPGLPSPSSTPGGPGCSGNPCSTLSIKCHDGAPGTPASHTTEDPLSPPCTIWNLSPGHDDPSHGIYGDHIDVVLLQGGFIGTSTSTTFDCRSDPNNPANMASATYNRDWEVLCHYFLSTFQTYGRTVILYRYDQSYLEFQNLQTLADNLHRGSFHPGNPNPPFAVLSGQDPEANPYFAKYQMEQFEFGGTVTGHVGNGFADRYFDAFLNNDWSQGGTMNGGVPFFWPFNPSVETTLGDGAAWLCQAVAGRPAANSDDPNLVGKPRKLALAYETTESEDRTGYATRQQYADAVKALANQFAVATNQRCGHQVFDEFGTDPATGQPVRALRAEDDLTFTSPGEPELATETIACMRHRLINPQCPNNPLSLDPDTTMVCLLCQNNDQVGIAEKNASYYPEYTFVSGAVADPWLFRADTSNHFVFSSNSTEGFNNAFGIRELWQLPGWQDTYWWRAWKTVDPNTTVSYEGTEIYEELMQLFAAVQLAGSDLSPAHVASGNRGSDRSFVGLYGYQRGFSFDASDPVRPPASPAAGYSLTSHAFLHGMEEERWDPAGTVPGAHFDQSQTGCFRILNNNQRFAPESDPGHNLTPFAGGQYGEMQGRGPSAGPTPPCTGDDI